MDVLDNRERQRFEISVGGHVAIADYRRDGDRIIFTHTGVPKALEGQGIGSALIKGALEAVRQQGLKVVPLCPFVKRYISKHPETQDLLA